MINCLYYDCPVFLVRDCEMGCAWLAVGNDGEERERDTNRETCSVDVFFSPLLRVIHLKAVYSASWYI